MIRRNTLVLIVILLIVIGFSFYLKNQKATQTAAATPTTNAPAVSAPLFAATDGQPTDISVKDSSGKLVEFGRNSSGKWVLKAPTDAEANQAAAEAAATQVTSLQILS